MDCIFAYNLILTKNLHVCLQEILNSEFFKLSEYYTN